MLNTKFSPWPSFTNEEADAVSNVILSNKVNYWTGEECRLFEKEFAEWVGTKYAVALMNGTVALDLALIALGIGPGDEVVVTPRSYIASVSCVVNVGANPVFADVDLNSGNLSVETIASKISSKTKAIICVHLAGFPCDMDPIMELAKLHNIKIIEDCAQAHGAKYKGRSVGSIGHIGAWSFCQDKIMSTGGEGGMVTTSDENLWRRMWEFKDHGKSYDAVYNRDHPDRFRWLHESIGTNWRMIEVQAVIGRIQLRRLENWHKKRANNEKKIRDICRKYSICRIPIFSEDIVHAHYKAYIYIESDQLATGWDRDRIYSEINSRGVPCFQGACSEIYREKAFAQLSCLPKERLPNAKLLGETTLMFLIHPTLTVNEMDAMCEVIDEVMSKADLGKSLG
jgi:dTDP-4-amino-4,6-dideoxygalactose transaminase